MNLTLRISISRLDGPEVGSEDVNTRSDDVGFQNLEESGESESLPVMILSHIDYTRIVMDGNLVVIGGSYKDG